MQGSTKNAKRKSSSSKMPHSTSKRMHQSKKNVELHERYAPPARLASSFERPCRRRRHPSCRHAVEPETMESWKLSRFPMTCHGICIYRCISIYMYIYIHPPQVQAGVGRLRKLCWKRSSSHFGKLRILFSTSFQQFYMASARFRSWSRVQVD